MSQLWGEIPADEWQAVPCIRGRPATEAGVAAGIAVFYVDGPSVGARVSLPCCAYQRLEDGAELPVVIIQAEVGPHEIVFGVRPLSGGNGVCLASEVRLLADGFPGSQ